jgi:hypothetical protein
MPFLVANCIRPESSPCLPAHAEVWYNTAM